MKPGGILSPATILFLLSFFLFSAAAHAIQSSKHAISFDAYSYNPSQLTVEVGDTIIWNGDFTSYPLVSTSIPSGAQPIGPVTSGNSFQYIVEVAGTYNYQNNIYAAIGMKGSFSAVFKPHGSQTNEGREFYLGMLYPTYNYVGTSSLVRQFAVYALVTTYYDNVINYSYYDPSSGVELTPIRKTLPAHSLLQIQLNPSAMRVDSSPEAQVYKACHITSKYPITVEYLSRGANSGGSYLALPVMGLGKNYVVASYNDDGGGGGALYGRNGLPSTYDVAGGDFMVIASEDATTVNITPATTTSGGKISGIPFSVGMNKGQCYFVRSDGTSADHDISGTLIQATKPVAVIAGHEDAYIGDVSGSATEGRDLMIEQMLPVEYWDTVGYLGIPLVQSAAAASGGVGDGYRVYTFDNATAKVQADVQGISGGYDMSTTQLHISEHYDITAPVDIYSTNGQKISVMQYDERSQPMKGPYPAPSMMTIIPHSRWRTSYNFSEFNPGGTNANANQYVGVIADSLTTIKVSSDGAAEVPIGSTGFSARATFSSVSNHYTSKGAQYDVSSHTFFLHSDYPFICYTYGMNQMSTGGFGGGYTFNSEYAAPVGMQLNTGIPPSFQVTVNSVANCGGWDVCVKDTSTVNPGVRAVILADDPDGVYFQRPGSKFSNVSLDSTSPDYKAGDLRPDPGSNPGPQYCFHVNINQKLHEAIAPLGIIDRNGNGLLIRLFRSAPTVNLSTSPVNSANSDSMFFPQQKIGTQICTTFVVKNTAPAGGSPLTFNNVKLVKTDTVFSIQSVMPALPTQIKAQDSLTIQLCYTSKDSLRHQDTLLISNDCFDIPISLDAHSSTGLISCEDIDFGNVNVGTKLCKTLMIRNIGSAPFTLMAAPKLSDAVNFTIDPAFLLTLPLPIPAGGKVPVQVCFDPTKPVSDSAGIVWVTDIDHSFASSGKNFSKLEGNGLDTTTTSVSGAELAATFLSVRPNPASGNLAIVSFALPEKQKATLAIFDVLGRQLAATNLSVGTGEFEMPIGYLKQGLYYVRLISDDIVLTQKLEVIR